MSKKGKSSAYDVSNSSEVSPIQDVSKEPKSFYAKQTLELNPEAKFKREYRNAITGRKFVEVKIPSKHGNGHNGRVRVVWSFDPKGEAMRKAAIARHHPREPLFPRSGIRRFPRTNTVRIMRFPRFAGQDLRRLRRLQKEQKYHDDYAALANLILKGK